MAQYRKKPVVIEAFQFDGRSNTDPAVPQWFVDALLNNEVRVVAADTVMLLRIDTLEGAMTAREGDWILQGVKGELYPCKPDIFEATYEAVNE